MWPLILSLIQNASNDEGAAAEKKQAEQNDVTYSKKTFDQNEWKKKSANQDIDQQRRSAIARALKASDNELPKQLNSEMYPEIKKGKVDPSNWRSVAGAAQAAQGINWNKLFQDYSGQSSALSPQANVGDYAGPSANLYSDVG